mmetsp:Transcript_17150/g.53176  ORF Transcript_17150/g.53176 Transcript_17150/m.53176 type:complete len:279 (-) Transcript_17150:331-1167(-)
MVDQGQGLAPGRGGGRTRSAAQGAACAGEQLCLGPRPADGAPLASRRRARAPGKSRAGDYTGGACHSRGVCRGRKGAAADATSCRRSDCIGGRYGRGRRRRGGRERGRGAVARGAGPGLGTLRRSLRSRGRRHRRAGSQHGYWGGGWAGGPRQPADSLPASRARAGALRGAAPGSGPSRGTEAHLARRGACAAGRAGATPPRGSGCPQRTAAREVVRGADGGLVQVQGRRQGGRPGSGRGGARPRARVGKAQHRTAARQDGAAGAGVAAVRGGDLCQG